MALSRQIDCTVAHASGLQVTTVSHAVSCGDLVHGLNAEVFEIRKAAHLHHAVTAMLEGKPHITLVLVSERQDIVCCGVDRLRLWLDWFVGHLGNID
jgi:hypothetical protein